VHADFVLQVNSTPKFFKGNFQDPTFFANVPLQVSAEREISRYQWQTAGRDPSALNWDVSTSQFAHPLVGSVDIIGSAMGPFVFAANMFNFVLLVRRYSCFFGGRPYIIIACKPASSSTVVSTKQTSFLVHKVLLTVFLFVVSALSVAFCSYLPSWLSENAAFGKH
jgi:hypothetical protein